MTGIQITQTTSQQFVEEITSPLFDMMKQVMDQLQPKQPEEYLTREAAAKLLNINISTLASWTKKGKLINYGLGGKVYYKRSEIDSALIRLN